MNSLRRRMVVALALFALAGALCFSALGVLFVYTVEDRFFNIMLDEEAAHQRRAWRTSGQLATPLRAFVVLHRSPDSFPADLAQRLKFGARGTEVPGEQGRHYHLRKLELDGAGPAYMVAEVSRELVVRPRLPFILTFLGLSALALLALTLGVGYWLARRATEPLSRLAQLVSNATPQALPRDFADRFPDNEIGAVARSLAGFIEREQHFTRDASHELRTPLAVIDGAASLLARQSLDGAGADQLQRIRSACAHMTQSVETLLSLAREQTDASAPERCALLPLVEAAVVRFAHLLDGKAVDVRVDLGPDDCLHVHRAALAILLSNLVSNAFSHTMQGEIRIYVDAGRLVVQDSGPGIDPALKGRLFEAGVKGEGSSGLGLGLSIAHRLAERYGMRLEIDSGPEGGTRATIACR